MTYKNTVRRKTKQSFLFAFSCLLLSSFVLGGCASKYGAQTTKVEYYKDCYDPIASLRQSEFMVEKSAATGAVVGGLLGAAAGYLVTGKASGAAVGAAAGAAAGGTYGYVQGKSEKEAGEAERMAYYTSRMDGDISGLDHATAAAQSARECYERQFTVAVSEFKSGNITKDQFRSRYQEISSGMEEASRILGSIADNATQVSKDYQAALDAESQRLGVPPAEVEKMRQQSAAKVARASTPAQPAKTGKSGKTTAAAKAPKAEKLPAGSNMDKQEAEQLKKLSDSDAAMGKAVDNVRAEQKLLDERVQANRKAAQDLMT